MAAYDFLLTALLVICGTGVLFVVAGVAAAIAVRRHRRWERWQEPGWVARERPSNVVPLRPRSTRADRELRRWMAREEAYDQWRFDHQIPDGPSARAMFASAWDAGRRRPRRQAQPSRWHATHPVPRQ